MNSEIAKVTFNNITSQADGYIRRETAPPRSSVRLTVAERRFLLVLMDLLLINGSLLAAVIVWGDFVPSPQAMLANAKWFVTLTIVWWWFGSVLDIYNLARSGSLTSIIISIGLTALLTGLVYLCIPWLTPPILSRSYAYGFVLFAVATALGWRVFYARVLNHSVFWRRGLILGTGLTAQTLMRDLSQANQAGDANPFRGTGYQIVGLVAEGSDLPANSEGEFPLLGNVHHLVRLARLHHADEIIVALDDQSALDDELSQVLLDCRELGLRVSSVVEIYERLTARLPVEYARCNLQVLLGHVDSPSVRLYLAAKNVVDWLLALVGLIGWGLMSPCVALANALWSPGPLFYRQVRLGKGGRPFTLIKFRSMTTDAERNTGAVWSEDDDPRITPIGRWLRKTRLDELPQVINVLRGEMSIVGPRPERPYFVGQLARDLPLYRARHAVKPGITGWAQIRRRYANSIEDSRIKLEYDLYYIKYAGLYLDLLILLQTVPVILLLKGK